MKPINLLQFIFGALLLLKITHTANVAEWSWFWVVFPLMLDFVVKFFRWIFETLNLRREATKAVQDAYYNKIRENAVKKSLKDALK